jgi:hypothetical protein
MANDSLSKLQPIANASAKRDPGVVNVSELLSQDRSQASREYGS